MYSKAEFVAAFGAPQNPTEFSREHAEAARGRLPESVIEFWLEHGIGSYAANALMLCSPALFDPVLDRLLLNVPYLKGQLAAFAYTAFGEVLLWHVDQRDFVLFLQAAVFDDQTSRTETDPVPDDLMELYRIAGIDPPSDAADQFLAGRSRPADLWARLATYAAAENHSHEIGDDGRPLLPAIVEMHGPLGEAEIYARKPGAEGFDNIAASYVRRPLKNVFLDLPSVVIITTAIDVEGLQQIQSREYPAGTE